MKREELESLKVGEENLPKEVVDNIMAMYGKSFKEKDETITKLTTEKETLSSQLTEVNEKVKGFEKMNIEEIKNSAKEWQDKYDNDTKELNNKLSKQQYDFKVKELTNGLKFSSESAKRTFINDLIAKELKLEEDKILGYDDFVKSYQESDPNAFAKEETPGITTNTGGEHTQIAKEEDELINKIMGLD